MFYKVAYSVVWAVFHLFYKITVIGRENIPRGTALVCGNHTSLTDPLFVAIGMSSKNQLHFMAKAELLQLPIIGWLLDKIGVFAVNRGKSDIKAIKKSLHILNTGKKLMMFPEGTRVREADKSQAKTGAAMLSLKTGAPILPVYVTAGDKRLFGDVRIIIGKPFLAEKNEQLPQSENYREVADSIMRSINSLGEKEHKPGLAS